MYSTPAAVKSRGKELDTCGLDHMVFLYFSLWASTVASPEDISAIVLSANVLQY